MTRGEEIRSERETFVRAWNLAASAVEAAERLGISRTAARSRAAKYRREGIPLKKHTTNPWPLDVETLARIARETGGQ